jgi:hypothetical protein
LNDSVNVSEEDGLPDFIKGWLMLSLNAKLHLLINQTMT